MATFKRSLTFLLYLASEWLFCFLVLLPFMTDQWAQLVPFTFLAVIHCLLLGSLQKIRHSTLAAFLVVCVLTGLAALIIAHLSLFASILLTAMLTYFSIRDDEGRSIERLWRLIVLFAAIVCIYALFAPINQPTALFMLLFVELVVALVLIYLSNELSGPTLLLISGILTCTALLISVLSALLKPAVTFIYDSLFHFMIKPISYGVFSVVFGWLNGRSTPQARGEITKALQASNAEKKSPTQKMIPDLQPNFNFGLLFGILISALLLFIAFWQLRRIKMSKAAQHDMQNDPIEIKKIPFQKRHNRKKENLQVSAPKHPVRRAVYRLQKLAKKMKCGRYPSESLREWANRLNLDSADLFITFYEKVRYGNQELTASEQAIYLDAVHDAEKQIKHLKHKTVLKKPQL